MFKGNGSNGNVNGSGTALLNRIYDDVSAPPVDGNSDREVSAFVGGALAALFGSGTSSSSSTKIAPLSFRLSTTNLLWTISWRT